MSVQEYKARHEERVKRFGQLTDSQTTVTADVLNNLYTGQVIPILAAAVAVVVIELIISN